MLKKIYHYPINILLLIFNLPKAFFWRKSNCRFVNIFEIYNVVWLCSSITHSKKQGIYAILGLIIILQNAYKKSIQFAFLHKDEVRIIDNDTSHVQRYIVISNWVINNIADLGGVDTFGSYITILLNKNWKNVYVSSPNILLKLINREQQYFSKRLREQLSILKSNSLIQIDSDIDTIGINSPITITALRISGGYTRILCVNEHIFEIQSSVNNNILFAVYVRLKMAEIEALGYARVMIKTLKNSLGVSEKTILKALDILSDNGYIDIIHGRYDPKIKQRTCNRYRVNDYNSLMYRAKHGLVSFPERQAISSYNEAQTAIEAKISEVLADPEKFSPCVFKGLPAKLFGEHYNALPYDSLFLITSITDMTELLNEYSGTRYVSGGMIVLHIEQLTEGIEDCLVKFIDDCVLPIILLLGEKAEIANNTIKSQVKYIFS